MLPPRPLLAACLLLLGGLAWSVHGTPAPRIALDDAARWDGQAVRVEGWAQGVARTSAGSTRFLLVEAGAGLSVLAPAPGVEVGEGDRVIVSGRLLRGPTGMTLLAEDAGDLRSLVQPEPERPALRQLAAEPGEWAGRRVELRGTVAQGGLEADGVSLATGEGPWPRSGAVLAVGLVRYEAACVCHRFDATEVRPWTP